MQRVELDHSLLETLSGKTAVVTGAAGGIGISIVTTLISKGANVVMADLEHSRQTAETIIESLPDSTRAVFIPTNILLWNQMTALFKDARARFGSVEIVIANAGVMESEVVLDMDQVNESGDLLECQEFSKVIDINIKGTMNTLRQGLFHMKDNPPCFPDKSRGSILLVASTSGYFGATGVAGYITLKHGLTGMLRGSQLAAEKYSIRINGVAPFVTPTSMSQGFTDKWKASGLPINTMEDVAKVIVTLVADCTQKGSCYLACGPILREMENSRKRLLGTWLGDDTADLMAAASRFFADQGGYPLPHLKAMNP